MKFMSAHLFVATTATATATTATATTTTTATIVCYFHLHFNTKCLISDMFRLVKVRLTYINISL